jgi:hypothetical protein
MPNNERPADGELLLLAAGEVSTSATEHAFQDRKQLVDMLGNDAGAIAASSQPDTQILLHRELGKDLAPLRDVANAEAGTGIGPRSSQIAAIERKLARGQGQKSHDALEQGRLAHAVATHEAGARPLWHRHVEVPESVAPAVKLVYVFESQHCAAHSPK